MKNRFKIVLLVLIATPLLLQLWMLQFLVKNNSSELSSEYRAIRQAKLDGLSFSLKFVVNEVQQNLILYGDRSVYSKLTFGVTETGDPVNFDNVPDLLTKTAELWNRNKFLNEVINSDQDESGISPPFGWIRHFDGETIKLYFWQKTQKNYQLFQLNYAAILAEILAKLPIDQKVPENWKFTHFSGKAIYQWGRVFSEGLSLKRLESICKTEPFDGFRFQLTMDQEALPENLLANKFKSSIHYIAGLISIVFIGLAIYFYRASHRAFSDAQKKVNFVSRISHELKTPLSNICLYSELMAEKSGKESPISLHLQVISSEANRLSRLIHNILTFAGQNRGVRKLRCQTIELADVLDQFIELIVFPLQQKNFEIEVDSQVSGLIYCDGDLIKQVLGNLISNVEKYAPDGKFIKIDISVKDCYLNVAVEDRGAGIPASERRQVFKPFYRCNNSLNEGVSGSGIGLTISKELCALHGGTLVFENLDEGCRFSATFKLED